jgi:hypothetical protein
MDCAHFSTLLQVCSCLAYSILVVPCAVCLVLPYGCLQKWALLKLIDSVIHSQTIAPPVMDDIFGGDLLPCPLQTLLDPLQPYPRLCAGTQLSLSKKVYKDDSSFPCVWLTGVFSHNICS